MENKKSVNLTELNQLLKSSKFKYKQMKAALLQSICNQPLKEQKKILDDIITNWKGALEQTDDILIIGFKI